MHLGLPSCALSWKIFPGWSRCGIYLHVSHLSGITVFKLLNVQILENCCLIIFSQFFVSARRVVYLYLLGGLSLLGGLNDAPLGICHLRVEHGLAGAGQSHARPEDETACAEGSTQAPPATPAPSPVLS